LRPYDRNVYRLRFFATAAWGEFLLAMRGGAPVPAGAQVDMDGNTAVVGEGGLVTVPMSSGKSMQVSWSSGRCQATPAAAQWKSASRSPVALVCE
jgi:outer membrane usher protein FimD/PapC